MARLARNKKFACRQPNKAALLLLAIWMTEPHSTFAQTETDAAGAVLRQSLDTQKFYQRQRELQRAAPDAGTGELSPDPVETSPRPGEQGPVFFVRQFVFTESEVLDPAELRAAVADFEARELNIAELQLAVAAVNELYRRRGFITARAFLPPQKIQDGQVRINLVEARLDQVLVENNRSTDTEFIHRRIDLDRGSLVELDKLERQLIRFNLLNDVKLRARLAPGAQPQTTSFILQASEPRRRQLALSVDNAGRESVGEERVGLQLVDYSLTGLRDRLLIGGNFARGTDAAYFSYGRPINSLGTRLAASYDYSQIEIINGELQAFDITGSSSVSQLQISHPLSVRRTQLLNASAAIQIKESETDFGGVDRFDNSVRSLGLALEYQRFLSSGLLYFRPGIDIGVEDFGGELSFTTLDTEFAALMSTEKSHEWLLRLRGQWSDRERLPGSEQFQVGGVATVRGYPEGALIGDNGYLLSVEHRIPLWRGAQNSLQDVIRLSLFFDHGAVYNNGLDGTPDRNYFMSAVGWGLNFQLGQRLQASLQMGIPLRDLDGFDDDYRVHFSLTWRPLQ